MIEIVLATSNEGKVNEIREILSGYRFSPRPDSLMGVAETGNTFFENALLKAKTVSQYVRKPAISDDSGLEVEALQGAPGVMSAYFAGQTSSDVENCEKVLRLLSKVDNRKARFRCVSLIYDWLNSYIISAEGTIEGSIAYELDGEEGFGYDPIFIPEGFDKPFARLGLEIKNSISHRSRSLAKLKGLVDRFYGEGRV